MRTLRRFYLLVLMAIGGVLSASASVWVKLCIQTEGKLEVIKLQQQPKLTFGNGFVTIEGESLSTTYSTKTVKHMYFDVESQAEEVTPPTVVELPSVKPYKPEPTPPPIPVGVDDELVPTFTFSFDGTVVHITDSEGVGAVSTFALNGQAVQPDMQKTDTAVDINMSTLPQGVYIVKVGARSYKIVRK